MLFDRRRPRLGRRSATSARQALDRLADGDRYAPILDWTDLDLAPRVPGRNVFAPTAGDAGFPTSTGRSTSWSSTTPTRLAEARRVAQRSRRALATAPRRAGRRSSGRAGRRSAPGRGSRERARDRRYADPTTTRGSRGSRRRCGERPDGRGDRSGRAAGPASADADVVVVVEPGVLPLPGCIDALAATLRRRWRRRRRPPSSCSPPRVARGGRMRGLRRRLRRRHRRRRRLGRGLLARVRAPGLGGERGARAAPARSPGHDRTERALAARCVGRLVGAATELLYQPDAWAVRRRRRGDTGRGRHAGIEEWAEALARCPERPVPLDDTAWRSLLARCDAREAWR